MKTREKRRKKTHRSNARKKRTTHKVTAKMKKRKKGCVPPEHKANTKLINMC